MISSEPYLSTCKILDFKKIISTVRSRNINCQVIVQSAAQLSDRYEKKEWEEISGNCDTQLFLGCNDQMTAEYISKKCGMITIGVTNNSMPLMPLFSPVYHSTRPYSQTRSNTQRALMLPDEILRLCNEQVLVLLRGQKPLLLHKIIPDELPAFQKLTAVRITDYIPAWKREEDTFINRLGKVDAVDITKREELLPVTPVPPGSSPMVPKSKAEPTPARSSSGSGVKYSFISVEDTEMDAEGDDVPPTVDTGKALTEEDLGVFIVDVPPEEIIR